MTALNAPSANHTTKELLWLSCREKRCCHNTRVIVNGRDIWRIARTLDLAPWDFTLYCAAHPQAADAFQLEPGGVTYQIILSKRGSIGARGAPCTFLWKLADGHAQCGLGALRPIACQCYPAMLVEGALCVDSAACSCRRWSLLDVDAAAERIQLNQMLAETAAYAALVARWNRGLREARSYREYCDYLLRTYDAAEART
jgi:Fe-S-cluster containining protein